MRKLEGLKFHPLWTTQMGCMKGCLDFLGARVSTAWLFGGTGHAFVINMHDEVCPSGPTAWKTLMLYRLAPNIGCSPDLVFAVRSDPAFEEKQKEAFEFVHESIDEGIPCYGWELEIPEYYVISGYDDVGYYFHGCGLAESKGPKPYGELGATEIGCLQVDSVRRSAPADAAETVKAACLAARKHAEGPEEWVFPRYAQGVKGFESWADSLQSGKASDMGHRYNAEVWAECRAQACAFLEEAKERLAGRADALFDEAREHYGIVADRLRSVRELHPFAERGSGQERIESPESAEFVRQAAAAEANGLETLGRIAAAL
ncbi:MAG: hypothetical protein ACYSX0_21040 [Planctomycetota bacterium]|jgi:hypothetical protein